MPANKHFSLARSAAAIAATSRHLAPRAIANVGRRFTATSVAFAAIAQPLRARLHVSSCVSQTFIVPPASTATRRHLSSSSTLLQSRDNDASSLPEIIRRASTFGDKQAIASMSGFRSYDQLIQDSAVVAERLHRLRSKLPENQRDQLNVSFLCPNDYAYVVSLFAIWRAGGLAVPLCNTHPLSEMQYYVQDSCSNVVLYHSSYAGVLKEWAEKQGLLTLEVGDDNSFRKSGSEHLMEPESRDELAPRDDALLIYTSGTTSSPKGVVYTHSMIAAQIRSLTEAWKWQSDDHILHVLPLHHVHGVVNVLLCAIWSGATCEFISQHPFDPKAIWDALTRDPKVFKEQAPTLFMAVPTIYVKLIQQFEKEGDAIKEQRKRQIQPCEDGRNNRLRLFVSGSSALPDSVFYRWHQIAGWKLLERYGTSETGMVLSNPYDGERIPGTVGTPLPSVQVAIVDEETGKPVADGLSGELRVRGPTVFSRYWNRVDATKKAFDKEGYYMSGDIAVRENGVYKILGRMSVDIIKSGGYKISALDVERILLEHPNVQEVAVFGLPDGMYGEVVAAVLVPKNLPQGETLTVEALRAWGKTKMAAYKVPSRLFVVDAIARNSMGKINKKTLAKFYAEQ